MLERVEAKIDDIRGFGMTEYAEDATVVVEVVVEKMEIFTHFAVTTRSRELAHESRSGSIGESITARPLCWMRKASSRVTRPISRAATPYCLAIAKRAARFSGSRETMARAPRSPKRACSAGASSSRCTFMPKAGGASPAPTELKQDSAKATARPPSEMS